MFFVNKKVTKKQTPEYIIFFN